MGKTSKYLAKNPDRNGRIPYTPEEDAVWHDLIVRQRPIVKKYACPEYLEALARMHFPTERIPQPEEVSAVLRKHTGWEVAAVPALIPFDEFFALLADKKFPAASFIRSREEMDYLQEPDIFHEIFGHTPLLTDARFAAFSQAYGKAGAKADKKDHVWLARLYWFTVEFGLIRTSRGLRTYGAGLESSFGEASYSIDSPLPQRKPFDPIEALRTPYRIDIYQPVYFVIDGLESLFKLAQTDLIGLINEARRLGMYIPTYPPTEKKISWAA
ncbi:MAG: phenylalanine 4-monooxygenase [Gammaproteobacteria bacterium]|nr:phenylalanine 4-monooxygenase [Gammaproteobacteria bacterium]MBU6510611.1 phenylalanine 4-monooxygenase [Gammaproteobacteria bacterium]MDE1984363.1 phenylalanine 4-monooxygenase [Gammaproteobacteria bacterium]MDE2109395.1 phenylalanine 4-monooxygenase [Gammaproteobacteria bacterium]